MKCWSCDRGAYDSPYTCPKCKAHGASKGPAPKHMRENMAARTARQAAKAALRR